MLIGEVHVVSIDFCCVHAIQTTRRRCNAASLCWMERVAVCHSHSRDLWRLFEHVDKRSMCNIRCNAHPIAIEDPHFHIAPHLTARKNGIESVQPGTTLWTLWNYVAQDTVYVCPTLEQDWIASLKFLSVLERNLRSSITILCPFSNHKINSQPELCLGNFPWLD